MLKVVICQRRLAHFRVPAFNLLGSQADVDLTVLVPDQVSREGSPAAPAVGHVQRNSFRTVEFSALAGMTSGFLRAALSDADVIVLPWNLRRVAGMFLAVLVAHTRNVPVVLWGQGYSVRPSHIRDKLRNEFGRLGSSVVVYDTATASALRAHVPGIRVFAAVNAMDRRPIEEAIRKWTAQGPSSIESFRRRNDLHDAFVVVTLGRLQRRRRVDLLVRAAALARPSIPRLRLIIVGGGEAEADLRSTVDNGEMRDATVFAGPIYDEINLAPWLLSSHVACLPGHVGLGLHHVSHYGLPTIVRDEAARRSAEAEEFVPGESLITVPDNCPTSLARELAVLSLERERAAAVGSGALRTVRQLTLERMVSGLLEAIRFSVEP